MVLLEDFVIQSERNLRNGHPNPSGSFSTLILRIALAAKLIKNSVARAGIDQHLGLTGQENLHGDLVKILDAEAEQIFERILAQMTNVYLFASEEQDFVVPQFSEGEYIVVFDPIDGSSNIETGWLLGSTFGIYRKTSAKPFEVTHLYQLPSDMVAAGYIMYGTRTVFMYTTGNGVHHFELHPEINEFVIINPMVHIPQNGTLLSANLAYLFKWETWVQKYILTLLKTQRYSQRYSGTLVADIHRLLHEGGIFIYPGAKLRRPYEIDVITLLIHQAGGFSFSGRNNLMESTPTSLHQQSPFFAFGPGNLENFMAFAP